MASFVALEAVAEAIRALEGVVYREGYLILSEDAQFSNGGQSLEKKPPPLGVDCLVKNFVKTITGFQRSEALGILIMDGCAALGERPFVSLLEENGSAGEDREH